MSALKKYNVLADPGSEKSKICQHHGLTYSALDRNGKKVGVPIKASDFPGKPTLKYLERKFRVNEELRQPYKVRVRNAIDLALLKQPSHSLQSLISTLEREGIYTCRRENATGVVYGLPYVDYNTRCVFNGNDLGKPYSAKGLQERCLGEESVQSQSGLMASVKAQQAQLNFGLPEHLRSQKSAEVQAIVDRRPLMAGPTSSSDARNPLDLLVQPEPTNDYIPGRPPGTSLAAYPGRHSGPGSQLWCRCRGRRGSSSAPGRISAGWTTLCGRHQW
jgi:hypothetical protein